MTAVGYKTVVEFIPLEISDAAADFYSESISCCPKWLQHAGCLMVNTVAILITPLAMACDLVAAMVFKFLACCCTESKDEYNAKAWEYFKSGTAGGSLFICLAIMRMVSPGHAGAAPRAAAPPPPPDSDTTPPPDEQAQQPVNDQNPPVAPPPPVTVVIPPAPNQNLVEAPPPPQEEPIAELIPPATSQNLTEAPPPQQETA
jgi:hypothetical protein